MTDTPAAAETLRKFLDFMAEPTGKNDYYVNGFESRWDSLAELYSEDFVKDARAILEPLEPQVPDIEYRLAYAEDKDDDRFMIGMVRGPEEHAVEVWRYRTDPANVDSFYGRDVVLQARPRVAWKTTHAHV